jgi:hypothetical protein
MPAELAFVIGTTLASLIWLFYIWVSRDAPEDCGCEGGCNCFRVDVSGKPYVVPAIDAKELWTELGKEMMRRKKHPVDSAQQF